MYKTSRLFLVIGIGLVLVSLFLNRTGVYRVVLGPRRVFFLVLGLIIVFSAAGFSYFERRLLTVIQNMERAITQHPVALWWEKRQFAELDQIGKFKYINQMAFL